MTFYIMDQWEHNGRDDSDWYAVVFDSDTKELFRAEIGTTRFACALPSNPPSFSRHINGEWVSFVLENPTPEIIEEAKQALEKMILPQLLQEEESRIMSPGLDKIFAGMTLVLKENHRCHQKEWDEESCLKCSGSGKWTNPRNTEDKRDCFTCKGSGKFKAKIRTKKENDKIVWQRMESGQKGKVIRVSSYGNFYNNGYNQPNAHNTTVKMELDDGRFVSVPLHKLRLDEEMKTEEQVRELAKRYAQGSAAFYAPFRTAGISFR